MRVLARHASRGQLALLLLIGLLCLPHAIGITSQAGVKAGDWASYVVSQHATGNANLIRNYQEKYVTYADVGSVRLNVTQVLEGSNVSLIEDVRYQNGTSTKIQRFVDVSQSITTDDPPRLLMANMTTLSFLSTGNFSYVPRTVNNLEVDTASGGNSSALRYSWDEFTGILLSEQFVYIIVENDTSSGTGTFTQTLAMTGTNLWHYVPPSPRSPPSSQPQDFTFAEIYALAGVGGALVVGIVAYARRRSPEKRSR